jgi:magnesium transporter
MSHPLFAPEAKEWLENNDTKAMETFCETLHPATVAESLEGEFSIEDTWRFLRTTSIKNQAAIFAYFDPTWQVKMVQGTGQPAMARLIEQMSHDDRVDLLRRLKPDVADSLLRLVDEADRRDIATLVKYPEGSTGALMTTDYAWLPANITVDEALERLRKQAPDRETIYYVYIVDDQRKLLGVASLRDLIMASRTAVIRDIMDHDPIKACVTDDREQVAEKMRHYDLLAVPVVDKEGKLVGIVTYDDAIDVVVSEATEDAHRMGAVGPMTENYLEAGFTLVWRKRAIWLACLFLAELFTFTALAYFEDAIAEVVVLSLFVPLCISTGGNSGSQAATLITRAMALGQVTARDWWRVLRHEIAMGLALGLTLGAIGFFRASLTPESVRSSSPPRYEAFTVTVPADQPLTITHLGDERIVRLPADARQIIEAGRAMDVVLPEKDELAMTEVDGQRTYTFPTKCTVRRPPVPWFGLSLVIAFSVSAICLWGTMIGAMLPMVFKRLGVDPGVASSPFVATFVDVTGIVIYFSIAKTVLWQLLA